MRLGPDGGVPPWPDRNRALWVALRAPSDGGAAHEQALYVTTSGGLMMPYQGKVEEAKLLRLDVGEHGQSLL